MANSETLRDLIRINNDRVTGYSKAATQTDDQDLQSLFSQLGTAKPSVCKRISQLSKR